MDLADRVDTEYKKRILIVDDQPSILNLLDIQLTAAGYEVITASNGEEGISQAKKYNPDIILTDYLMPIKDGIKMTEELRQELGYKMPIMILATASMMDNLDEIKEKYGFTLTLTKPYKKLVSTIDNLKY